MNESSAGDISRLMTRLVCPVKYRMNLLSCNERYLTASSRFVDAWMAAFFECVKRIRSTPYF